MLKNIKKILHGLSNLFMSHREGIILFLIFVQTGAIAFGVIGLYQTKKQIQGSTVQATFQTTKALTLTALEDPDIRPLLYGAKKLDRVKLKQRSFLALLVNHYYTIFRQYSLGNLPKDYWEDVERDARNFFREFIPKDNWDSMRENYTEDFVKFVDSLYSNKDAPASVRRRK